MTNILSIVTEKLEGWITGFIALLPNIVLALLVVLAAVVSVRAVRRLANKLLSRFTDRPAVQSLLSNTVAGVFVFAVLILVLNILHLQSTVSSLLTGAGIAGLVLGLAFQEPIANTFAGVALALRSTHNVGDHIEVGGYEGKIEEIGLRRTHIRLFEGPVVVMPNKTILSQATTNYTLGNRYRIDVACGISYDADLRKVKQVARQAILEGCECQETTEVEFFYTGFGSSSIDFVVRFWHSHIDKRSVLQQRDAAIIALKEAFDRHGFDIPFPIRTLQLAEVSSDVKSVLKGTA